MKRLFRLPWRLALWLLLASPHAWTAEVVDYSPEYARIDAQRAGQTAALDQQEAACYARFAVNACLKEVNSRRLLVMRALRKQESALHDLERRQKAETRLQQLRQKAQEGEKKQAQIQQDAQASTAAAAARLQAQQEKRAQHAQKALSAKPSPAPSPDGLAISPEEQALNRENYARKLADADKRREAIARRQRERTGKALPAQGSD